MHALLGDDHAGGVDADAADRAVGALLLVAVIGVVRVATARIVRRRLVAFAPLFAAGRDADAADRAVVLGLLPALDVLGGRLALALRLTVGTGEANLDGPCWNTLRRTSTLLNLRFS